jgi:serine/threonine protein kinase
MVNNPRRVGEGSYGCVHNPPLKCKNKPYNPDPRKVSKILTKKNANSELKEFKLIQLVDKKENFHLGKPNSCFPDDNEENLAAIDKCKKFIGNSNAIKKYKLLLLKNGGKDLWQIEKQYSPLTINSANRRRLENFWLDMSRIIYGSKVLIDNGIVHHDLKQQNIVYNEETGRVNFIDFGLMMTTKQMFKDADGSRYPYSAHWSFPPEISLYNYIVYKKLTSLSKNDKADYLGNKLEQYNQPFEIIKNDLRDINESNEKFIDRKIGSFYRMGVELKNSDEDYKNFLNKSFETFDNYAIGFSLFSMLKATKSLIDQELFNDLRILFLSMTSFDVFKRPSPSEVVDKYEFILKSNGLLNKYNMRFENHFLVDGTEKEETEKQTKELPKNIKTLIKEIILECPIGKERNPKTKRCINKCKDGYSRNTEFKCRRNKTQKKKQNIVNLVSRESDPVKIVYDKNLKKTTHKKVCASGKELNPKTNRCNNNCKEGYSRNTHFKCKRNKTQKKSQNKHVKKVCVSGKEMNPITNRCNNKCEKGYSRNAHFKCTKDKK